MKTREEIKEKILKSLYHTQKISSSKELIDYIQIHIDNIDRITDEFIGKAISDIISMSIYAYKNNNFTPSGVFHGVAVELDMNLNNLGDFYKNPIPENVDKFIDFINTFYGINYPKSNENDELAELEDQVKETKEDDINRRKGCFLSSSYIYTLQDKDKIYINYDSLKDAKQVK